MSTGNSVAVTYRIMASLRDTRQDFGFGIGVGPDRRIYMFTGIKLGQSEFEIAA
jgi:hypothetical protein